MASDAISAASISSPQDIDWDSAHLAFEVLGKRWTLQVIRELAKGETRYNELSRALGRHTSDKSVTRALKTLVREGVVERQVVTTSPPGVRYALTDLGWSLVPVIAQAATHWRQGKWNWKLLCC